MRNFLTLMIRRLPWVLVVVLLLTYFYTEQLQPTPQQTVISSSTVLKEIESIGKLELIRYNYQEITEITDARKAFDVLEYLFPENKAILISKGEAAGCIDLLKLTEQDITVTADTLFVSLPAPELCYVKIDLQNSRIYEMQTTFMSDQQQADFTQLLYRKAEEEIRNAALSSGILENTSTNARLVLGTLLKATTEKEVVFTVQPTNPQIPGDSLLLR